MPEPINNREPYPTTDEVTRDALSLRIISPAYASSTGELNAVLQYIYHSMCFEKNGYKEFAESLTDIAVDEMRHLRLLGKTVLALGASPVYAQYPQSAFNFYSTKYVAYSCTLTNMLEDDIIGEKHAVATYGRMLKSLKNEQIKRIISCILSDEKRHLSLLEDMLCHLKG